MPYADPEVARAKRNEWSKRQALKNKQYVLDFLKEHPCHVCGEADTDVLQFHHIQPGSNERGNGSSFRYSTKSQAKVQAEIDKCVVLCANCHVRVHKLASQMGIVY